MAKCICPDWRDNIGKVEAPRLFMNARNPCSANYDGKRFKYCPWCSSELRLEASDYRSPPPQYTIS